MIFLIRQENHEKEKNPHIGSTFDSFLQEERIYEEVQAAVIKKIIAQRLKRKKKNNPQATPTWVAL